MNRDTKQAVWPWRGVRGRDPALPLTGRDRCIIVEEIGKMRDIPFGAAVELLDQVLSGAIFSGGGNEPRREPPYAEYLGRLMYQVAARQDLAQEERRLLMYRIASIGSEEDRARTAPNPVQGFFARLRAPDRGQDTGTGKEEDTLPLPRDLMVRLINGDKEAFRALLGEDMERNLAFDEPGSSGKDPLRKGMENDIAGGDETGPGKKVRPKLTFEMWTLEGDEVKITPLHSGEDEEE